MELAVNEESVVNARLLLEHAVIDTLQQIENYDSDQNMVFANPEPQEVIPRQQNLKRTMIMRDLPSLVGQPDGVPFITNIRKDPVVAEVEMFDRLKNGSQELEKRLNIVNIQNAEYEKLLKLCKETEEELLEVKLGIEQLQTEDEGQELARLDRIFQECKADLNYVLETLCPEYKEDIRSYLSLLEREQDKEKWHKVPKEMDVGAIMLLLRAKIIVQHPKIVDHFKLAPIFDD